MSQLVLCIDDDKHSRDILELLLRNVMKLDQVISWSDSSNFSDRFEALPHKPSLVLMDIQIVPLSGYDMLSQIRQHQEWHDVIVVAVTAGVMEEQVAQMKKAGFDGLIGKPIMRHLFPDIVRRLLNGETIWYTS
jgi:CheY-like chemotaxis protein